MKAMVDVSLGLQGFRVSGSGLRVPEKDLAFRVQVFKFIDFGWLGQVMGDLFPQTRG